jgi:hypothetical protein
MAAAMREFSLGDWAEDSVGVFVDGEQVARVTNVGWPKQEHLPQDLLDLIRHGAEAIAALRQCRARLGEWVDAGAVDSLDYYAHVSAREVLKKLEKDGE